MRSILGGLLSAVLLGACGGVEPVEGAAPEQESTVSAQAVCDGHYVVKYYDKTYTSVLGTMTCECGQEPVWSGALTPYPKTYPLGACP
ncbi:hypothetical protein LZ198_32860 [Myxococcus sp. K15C18031901]|uniref:hypothetical protein n=1 Tax=Myxococcus dinghuensis TaxID=2906761 RepID=UPI0020A6ED8C|nr:hypothetical protein [Myxococcus dinghuensis]MCP3103685.1 hypothetical protein [Myxococcus dinghuensis]